MRKPETVNCEEIMTQPLKPIEFVVDNLITQGLFILAGAPKIGKSWLALDICLSVAKGENVLNAKTAQGTSLYLCLEDSRIRIQNRLYEVTDEPTEHLHFALIADTISNCLEGQIERFIAERKDPKIIFIDTLQKIRSLGIFLSGYFSFNTACIRPRPYVSLHSSSAIMLLINSAKRSCFHGLFLFSR